MIRLHPNGTHSTNCPACGAANALGTVRFLGAVTGVDVVCAACQTVYLQTLPNGQFNRFSVAISADYQHVAVDNRGRWLVDLVKRCLVETAAEIPRIYALPPKVGELANPLPATASPVLLLCLDPGYGHALMMLFNAQRHHEQPQRQTVPNRPIIAVVPCALAWLVPDYVAETWVVDLPLSALERQVPGLDAFVNEQLSRFQTVWFSHAHIHFDHRTARFSDFTHASKFDLRQFTASLTESIPKLTFILREDRLWLRHGWERLLHKALNRLGFGQKTRRLWARWQAVRYRELAHHIHQKLPYANIVAVGITGGGQYPIDLGYAVEDQRKPTPISPEQERAWCVQYARSQVVIGVHGSNMVLPTALAAGFVNLLPPDKLSHYAEDILLAHDNPIHQTLLGRFVSTSASPRQVADLVVSMLTEFPVWLAEEQDRDNVL
ncbi:hypothetical protein [Fibrella aquatilis]|uniref:Uncharacterized protein n=1 Tax=Fibrella aquatilis TaxID=2817059 RepID=A0A939JVM0_9BACT|nr:hypothetical protein [Fibrella aquatilis]MBO0930997.1 hypothetical protein [Fibrella aquatilis]